MNTKLAEGTYWYVYYTSLNSNGSQLVEAKTKKVAIKKWKESNKHTGKKYSRITFYKEVK